MTYAAYVTRITNVRKHSNADRLQIGECFGNQVVIGLDTVEGEVGIYFPTDGQLMPEFLEANNLIAKVDEQGNRTGGFFDEKGRVRTQKFRKEKSDGFWCPLSYLDYIGGGLVVPEIGTPFTSISGHQICQKYVSQKTRVLAYEKKKTPKTSYPLFFEHHDTEQLEYNMNDLKEGNVLTITEKLHGTSQRTGHSVELKRTALGNFINGIFKREVIKPQKEYKYVCGTRHTVIKSFENYSGFNGGIERETRQEAHEAFVNKLHKGETIYYEIVGFFKDGTPIMAGADNKKIADKEFTKKWGKETVFSYGCPLNSSAVYVYRITMVNEDGIEVDYDWAALIKRCAELNVKPVPYITTLVYDGNGFNLLGLIEKTIDNKESILCPAHIMEGVVVRINGTKWKAYKKKSFQFRVLEGHIKDTGTVDVEESS